MAFAIALAFRAWGNVKSNPMVGCVVLDDKGGLLSYGCHEKFGGAHAEVNALGNADKSKFKSARVFVTLEPCSHFGKTPPCSDFLSEFPLGEIIVGAKDPNPLVSGKGIKKLEASGIKISMYSGKCSDDLDYLNKQFFHQMLHNESFMAVKYASSLDGAIALSSGESKWISNEKSRLEVQRLRAGFDALAFGAHTLMRDNPRFTVRYPGFEDQEKKIVIFCRNLDFSRFKEKQLFALHKKENIHWVTTGKHLREEEFNGMKTVAIDWGKESAKSDFKSFLYKQWKIGSVFCEPGSQLFDFLFKYRLIDRYYQFIAPVLLGSKSLRLTEKLKVESMEDAPRFELRQRVSFDEDSLWVYEHKD